MKHHCSSGLFLCSGRAILNAWSCSFSWALLLCLREFYYKGRCTGKIQRGKYWHSQKEWWVHATETSFSQRIIHHILAHLQRCAMMPSVLGWLAMGLSLLHSSVRVFRFPFSIFVKPNFKPVFYFAFIKKKASVCVSILLNLYFSACLKVFFFFLFLN